MRFAVLAGVLAATTLAAGCGGGSSSNGIASKSPAAIVAAAKAAIASATAVHVSGSIVTAGTSATLDLHLVGNDRASGHVTTNGVGLDLVRIGNIVYIRGSQSFYEKFAGATAAKLFKGKWLSASASTGAFASFAPITDMAKLFAGILGSHGKLAKGAETTVDGQKAIAIDDATKGGTLYVATTGKPFPVEIRGATGKGGTVTFDGWNKPATITAPKGAIDLSKLQSGG